MKREQNNCLVINLCRWSYLFVCSGFDKHVCFVDKNISKLLKVVNKFQNSTVSTTILIQIGLSKCVSLLKCATTFSTIWILNVLSLLPSMVICGFSRIIPYWSKSSHRWLKLTYSLIDMFLIRQNLQEPRILRQNACDAMTG